MKGPRQAVLLLAGSGSRLGVYTERRPKCMVEVAGEPILIRMLDQLSRIGVEQSILVVGYKAEVIRDAIGSRCGDMSIDYVENREWEQTNNIVSLAMAIERLTKDFLLLEGDLVFSDEALTQLNGIDRTAVSPFQSYMDGTVVALNRDSSVRKFFLKTTPGRPDDFSQLYKTVNIYSFSSNTFHGAVVPRLKGIIESGERKIFYEQAIADAVDAGEISLTAINFAEDQWCEIDTAEDLERAQGLFAAYS